MHIAKTFSDILKFNPYHDRLGRFTGPGGYASFSANPNTKAGKAAIAREQKNNPLVGAAYGTAKSPKQKAADNNITASRKQAKEILSTYGSGSRDNVNRIKDLYHDADVSGGARVENGKIKVKRSFHEKTMETAKDILRNTEYKDTSTEDEYNSLRQYIRATPVKISSQDKSNIADYGSYLRQNYGGVKVSNKGISLDSFYGELAGKFPQYFNTSKQSNPADQMQRINDVLNSLKPKTYKLSNSEVDQYAQSMANDIIRGYFNRAA